MKGRAGLAGRVSGYAEQATREGFSPNGAGRLLIRPARPVEEEQFIPTAGRRTPWPATVGAIRSSSQPSTQCLCLSGFGSARGRGCLLLACAFVDRADKPVLVVGDHHSLCPGA